MTQPARSRPIQHWPLRALCVCVWLGLLPCLASASPPFELIGSALGSGGLNARASGADGASTYFNPARLARAEPGLQLGWFVLNDAINITLYARQPSADIPVLALGTFQGRLPPIPTAWFAQGCDPMMGGRCVTKLLARPRQSAGSSGETRAYQVFSLVGKISERWLTLGVYGMVPLGSFLQGDAFFSDEREQYFSNSLHPEMYSDRLTAMALSFGAGSQLLDWLAVGVGVTLSLTTTADAGTYVGNSAQIPQTLQLSTKMDVSLGVAPYFGAVVQLADGWDLSLTAHTPQKMQIITGFGIGLPNGDSQHANRTASLAYEPWQLAAGTQYDFLRSDMQRLGVVLSATYALWSDYLNRQNERPLSGYGWRNTLSATIGLRHVYAGQLTTFLDAGYTPSPVPLQTGRTNYVDNDRYSIAAGVNYQFPLGDTKLKLRVGLQGQIHILPERKQTKIDPTQAPYTDGHYSQLVQDEWVDGATDSRGNALEQARGLQTNNPGWPGFSSTGMIYGGGLNVSLLY